MTEELRGGGKASQCCVRHQLFRLTQQNEFALRLMVSLFNSTQPPVDEKSQRFHHRLNLAQCVWQLKLP